MQLYHKSELNLVKLAQGFMNEGKLGWNFLGTDSKVLKLASKCLFLNKDSFQEFSLLHLPYKSSFKHKVMFNDEHVHQSFFFGDFFGEIFMPMGVSSKAA